MIFAASILLTVGVLAFVLFVRPQDLPEPEAASPIQHLEDRKAVIYDNLRDLNFEYRLGKLSEADYQKTKLTLQNELAAVLAEIDRVLKGVKPAPPAAKPAKAAPPAQSAKAEQPAQADAAKAEAAEPLLCPHCGAKFDKPMKFCGECGKSMSGAAE
ncbi:zinc ribbon domain-containing protein [Paludibaculum fermentans]|uniref:zinc ribbon domain-containing protein n=1 Tax=Paludibaculum fermentans TaxID=1473598 RepID=UPI003EBAEA02